MHGDRRQAARRIRIAAAELAAGRPHPRHVANGDEHKFRDDEGDPTYLASFTKGMDHDHATGLVADPDHCQKFVLGIDSGDPRDFVDLPLGPEGYTEPPGGYMDWKSAKAKSAKVRAWESQGAGNTYDLEGPDAQAVTMPPAPALGSDELTAEIAEVYVQALLRDLPFTEFDNCSPNNNAKVDEWISVINGLAWFKDTDCCDLTDAERARKRKPFTRQTLFRGITPGDTVGPYLSQFLLAGNQGINPKDEMANERSDGYVAYGALRVDQRVRFAQPGDDHMTNWDEWYDVQEGADLRNMEAYMDGSDSHKYRFITAPRDLATYVHYDALYEAYLNACLILLAEGIPLDPGIPFQGSDFHDHQQGFAHFGGPHILSLVTEVATRALKAVRYQKFNVHRRFRPEVLAARIAKAGKNANEIDLPELNHMKSELEKTSGGKAVSPSILEKIDEMNSANGPDANLPNGNYLLPMAFCEGSPMHPAYGAGHATVAGACVTILKAFFDHNHPLALADKGKPGKAFIPIYDDGVGTPPEDRSTLDIVDVKDETGAFAKLTVEGELNKLASNISIGRNWAGVHYFSDYIESLRMGEQIALGILEEQKLTYGENFSMTVPLFDGGSVRI